MGELEMKESVEKRGDMKKKGKRGVIEGKKKMD